MTTAARFLATVLVERVDPAEFEPPTTRPAADEIKKKRKQKKDRKRKKSDISSRNTRINYEMAHRM